MACTVNTPGWWGMTSPLYSELPQELLLEVEPMRPETQERNWLLSFTLH